MKNKRIWSVMIVIVMVFGMFLSSRGVVLAEAGMKHLKVNQTTLEFKEIIYVDGVNGNDEAGDGSKDKPFATVVKGFDYMNENCREDGAIVIADGVYNADGLFQGASNNLNSRYSGLKLSVIAENLGNVKLTNTKEWMIIENNINSRIKVCLYGIQIEAHDSFYHLGGDDWTNEFYNCVFSAGYGGYNYVIESATVRFENCIFNGDPWLSGSKFHIITPIAGTSVNCASTTQYIEPYAGTKESSLYNVAIDSDYNITSDGWQNTGTGTNPDGSQAHIGVYGGEFAWNSDVKEENNTSNNDLDLVLEINEKLLLSVDGHFSENINMAWTSSNESIATVDKNGFVTALKEGETTITVKSKNGKYEDAINILVVEDADDYRLAVDLKVGESARATIDKNKHTANVTWTVADETVATVSSKGKITAQSKGLTIVTAMDKDGKEFGQVYVRVR